MFILFSHSQKEIIMKTKKSTSADLEQKRPVYFQIGMILVLAALFVAFEWPTKEFEVTNLTRLAYDDFEFDEAPVTFSKEEQPKVLPPPPKPRVLDEIKITSNETEIETELEFLPSEATELTPINFAPMEEEEENVKEDIIFTSCEKPASFPGGESALMKFLNERLEYPAIAIENRVEGRVMVRFTVNKKGEIEDAQIYFGSNKDLNKAALEVIEKMPKWIPAQQADKNVKFSVTVPIMFVLGN